MPLKPATNEEIQSFVALAAEAVEAASKWPWTEIPLRTEAGTRFANGRAIAFDRTTREVGFWL
jgi:hypothetical protein